MRIEIKDQDASQYIPHAIPGSDIIGKITRKGPGGTGALILLDTWEFVQVSNGVEMTLDQSAVYVAIIRAILAEFCEEQADLALDIGYSLDAVRSWSCGRRVPTFGTVKLILLAYDIIKQQEA